MYGVYPTGNTFEPYYNYIHLHVIMQIKIFLGQGKVREFFFGQEVQMQGFIHHSLPQSANSIIETVAKLPHQFNRIYTKALPGLSF